MAGGKKSEFKGIKVLIILNCILLLVFTGVLFFSQTAIGKGLLNHLKDTAANSSAGTPDPEVNDFITEDDQSKNTHLLEEVDKIESELEEKEAKLKSLIAEADLLALSCFYDEAIERIQSYDGDYTNEDKLLQAIERYEEQKDSLVLYEGPINHVFFHSLIVDTDKAFDGDSMENGYNYWMTTVSEFNKMMEQMYERGYMLISIHDIAGPVEKNGKTIIQKKELYLPPGKKPFVLSQDDVNYYDYMKEDGFASRLLIDDNGNSACEIRINGKKKIARDYDVVPLLDVFVEQHPDFSYQGAKGIIAVTGYEGALGYRTNNKNSPTYEEDRVKVQETANALKKLGWEFASHSYGHGHMNAVTLEKFKRDTKRWQEEVGDLIGDTDIYIYPYGEEIGYPSEKYRFLKSFGFNYFCGVYAKPWIELTNDYVRMTRCNLDGFTMHFYPERLKELFDVDYVFDKDRPRFR